MFVLLVLGPSKAFAEVGAPMPTVQAVAADATWLAYTPPPEHPGIVCMVDSGVDPNPDTEAAVIGGQALAPETETNDEIARLEPRAQPGNHPNGHGTLMAMMMAAPINGWGMVGIAPTSVRVYNMKALSKGETTFPFSDYAAAIEDCDRIRKSVYPAISVINLSIGGEGAPGRSELVGLENYAATARLAGMNIVAAAGNEGGPVLYPAASPRILAVGAGDAGSGPGALCSFASRGEGLDLIAPGCDMTNGLQGAFEDDGSPAFGSGSSQASALVSAALASMRAYAPRLSPEQAEGCFIVTARGGSVDVEAAFDACGLSRVVEEGQTAEQAASNAQHGAGSNSNVTLTLGMCTPPSGCAESQATTTAQGDDSRGPTSGFEPKVKCPTPRIIGVKKQGSHLVLESRGRPHGCRLQARLRTRRGHGYRWVLTRSTLLTELQVPARPGSGLQARYVSCSASRTSSNWVAVPIGRGSF